MKLPDLKIFSNRTMGFKLTVIFLSVILIPMTLLAYISYRVIDTRLMNEARERIDMGLKAAWTEYYVRGEQMRYGMLQAASTEEIKNAVARRDKNYLKKMMIRWKQLRPYVDVWAVVDGNGRVIARLNTDFSGDDFSLGGLVQSAIETGEPMISTEILEKDILKMEGNGFKDLFTQEHAGHEAAAKSGAPRTMALVVVTPVISESQRAMGAIITGDVLNNDNYIADTVSRKIPGLFTTVSVDGVRILTNLIDQNGSSVKGTRLSAAASAGINNGRPVFEEWSIPGMTYISVFEPIKDHSGKAIGSLDVGISKEKLWAIQKENQKVIAAITVLGLTVSLVAGIISTFKITRPLKSLRDKIMAFAGGDMGARIEVSRDCDTKDELTTLARSFNSMMDEVRKREDEKGSYLKEIEEKNSEFAELNEELKKTNEELEIAYEETQSQTEELHAINEELKLLNEDLDRKNIELQKANRIITTEEEELKKAKDKLRLIYDSIRDHILLVDYDLRILEANRNLTETLKLAESDVIGRHIYRLFGMETPEKDCPVRTSIDTMVPVETDMTAPDGKVLRWHSFPLMEGNEETRRAVVYIKDVTESRLFTNKLIQTDKLSSLGELVSGVAHELNNPLTGIMCFSELLLEEKLGDGVSAKLRRINDASHRCKKIIDNLLTFARWKRPERKLDDINRVIKESVDLRSYQLKVDNIEIELDLDESIPCTMLDENQIQQVFLNLINNAGDAIKEKGGKGRIRITSRQAGDKLVVKCEDTGKGMIEEVANKIFDPFFTTKGVGKGTGLGLSISYGIINEHGGNIYATSVVGSGTTFIVELPVIENHELEENGPGLETFNIEALKGRARGLKVLIIDDEPIVLDLLNETLCNTGFTVEKSSSGEEAVSRLKAGAFDLIISDIKMPGLDGRGLYREVKSLRPEALDRIIFITGDSVNRETQSFLNGISNISLRKPFTVDELNEVISRIILKPGQPGPAIES